jgi:hypothetical protein
MQYVLLIYHGTIPLPNTPEFAALSEKEQKRIYNESTNDYAAINATAGVTPGLPLGLPGDATTVWVNDEGKMVIADGPFINKQSCIGGWYIYEADDLDAALDLAARIPQARFGGAIEVRPVATYW